MVRDARDNSTYWIQKLADGNCWMLTNLAYAGGGTNTYGDVMSTGTIIKAANNTWWSYTQAAFYDVTGANPTTEPTAPSTSTNGTGQYGYLYNWCAAMGGQNTAACANATTPAPIPTTNICPAGWRLPTVSPTNEFTALNTAINAGSTSSDAGLLTSGLFQRSGRWNYGFYSQGSVGHYWSSSPLSSATSARYLAFDSAVVGPAYDTNKYYGFAVRCISE